MKKRIKYPLDRSAIIHLASMNEEYTNAFRISVTLSEPVCPQTLQNALDNITPRFPTIVAGIKRGIFNYYILPVEKAPCVEFSDKCLEVMSKDRIATCATRVLYNDCQIAVEIFHSLTDGTGGKVFLSSLMAEYLSLKHSVKAEYSDMILSPCETVKKSEVTDDFRSYIGRKPVLANNKSVYKIPGRKKSDSNNQVISMKHHTQKLLDTAHKYNVSLTTFLTAVMAETILHVQKKNPQPKKTIQIMVPVNLRNKFKSNTLYNFSLYALARILPSDENAEFEHLIEKISGQLKKQFDSKHLQGMITMNTRSQNSLAFRCLPLCFKVMILKIVYHLFGERNSCISISNFGELKFPEEYKTYIDNVECMLTPRRNAPYNCSLISYNGKLNINFTKNGSGCGLDKIFSEKLESKMLTAA